MENNNRQGCRWVKASERLPEGRGKENSVIIRGCNMPRDIFGHGVGGKFVAYGFINFDKENPKFYFEHGKDSYLSNETIEWLDESIEPCATSSERIKELELGIIRMHENMLLGNHVEANRIGVELINTDANIGKIWATPSPSGDRDCEELKERLIAFGKENNEQFKRISELERGLELMIDQFNPDACDEKEVLDNPTQYEYGDVGRARIIVGIYKAIHNLAKQLLNL